MKFTVAVILVVLCWLGSVYGAHHYSKEEGVLEGIKLYHQQCFEVGGYIIGPNGEVVICQGQGTVPKDELPNFKDGV